MPTIVSASDNYALWTWGIASDATLGRDGLHVLPIIAWSVDGDGDSQPITPVGKADADGCWATAVNGRFITSTGEMLENQESVMMWLKAVYSAKH